MQTDNLIKTSVGVALGVVLLVILALPIISSATETETTFNNDGVFNYGVFTPSDTYALVYDPTNGITANGTTVNIEGVEIGTNSTRYSIIASEDVIIRFGSATSGYVCQIVGVDSDDAGHSPAPYSMTAEISNGQLVTTFKTSADSADVTYTFDFEKMYAIVPETDTAVLKVPSDAVHILKDSYIYGTGLTTVSHWSNMVHIEGSYEDGLTITSPNLEGATFGNVVWNIETVDGYIDLYKLTSIEFDITYGGATVHATYSYFGVPAEVTAEKAVHLDSTEITMLELVPLLLAVALVLGVVAYAVRARLS